MKKNFKYFVMAAVALLAMSACNNEMDEQNAVNGGELQPVQFQMAMANTRTVTDAVSRVTSWKVGDAIGIYALPAGTSNVANAKATNAKYVLGSDNTWKAEAGSEIYPEEALDYYAYYPYQADITDPTAINISAKVDQSTTNGDDYGASDVLAGQTKNVAAGQGNVTLAFKHMFAMVETKVEGDKVTKQPTKVELKGVRLDAVLNIMAATPAATVKTDATAKDVTMYYLAREGNADAQVKPFSFRATVPAQEIAANTPLVAIYAPDADNKTYTMQHTAAVPYNAGVFRQLNVNIGSTKVSLTIPKGDLTISPWEESPSIGGEGGEVTTPLILPFAETLTSIAENKPTTPTFTSDAWFALKKVDYTGTCNFSIEVDPTTDWKKAAKLEFTSIATQAGSWFIAAIGYFHSTPLDVTATSIYKLTFKAKASQNTGTAATEKVVIACRNAKEDGAFQISAATKPTFSNTTATSTTKALSAADTWETITLYINFAGKGSGVGSISNNNVYSDTTTEDYAQCNIRFYPASSKATPGTSSIYISDVTLEPYIAQ